MARGQDTAWRRAQEALPLLAAGRSKLVYQIDETYCLVRLVPTLDSQTYDRHEVVPGTAELRLDFYQLAVRELQRRGVRTCFVRRQDATSYVARRLTVPPFETIVKSYAVGSTLRLYPGLFREMEAFDPPVVKFDYRVDPVDQAIGEDYLEAFGLKVPLLKELARHINEILSAWLRPLLLVDICLIFGYLPGDIDYRNPVLVSEVSPDCMRIRDPDGNQLDKDLFRGFASHQEILGAWAQLVQHQRSRSGSARAVDTAGGKDDRR